MARRGGAWMTGYFGMARRHASMPSAKCAAGGGGCAVVAGVWRNPEGISRGWPCGRRHRAGRQAVSVSRDPARPAAAWRRHGASAGRPSAYRMIRRPLPRRGGGMGRRPEGRQRVAWSGTRCRGAAAAWERRPAVRQRAAW